jgi:tRNA A-37 threonylcarbamoyl transferase component Bud32
MSTATSDWQDFDDFLGHWRVRADWKETLLGRENGLFFGRVLKEHDFLPPERHVVKDASHRLVYCVDTPQGAIFVKHYFVRGLRAWLRSWLRPPKAFLECDKALSLLKRDVPTVEPLAAYADPDGSSCLVTLAVEEAVPLDQLLLEQMPQGDVPWQRQMTQELAAFVARLHDAGVTHQDFHPGNILIRMDEFGQPQWTLIDPYEVRLGPPLGLKASCANLVQFALWFLPRTTPTDRLRFWRYYWLERQGLSLEIAATERELLPQFEQDLWRMHLQRWRQREHRYLSDNRDFYRLRHAGNRAWAVRDLPPELLKKLLDNPDAPFTWDNSRLLKDSPSSTVAEVVLPDIGKTVIYKRFLVTKRTDPFLNLFRDSPALKSWRNGHRLLEVGLPTARPLAVLHRRRYGLTWECYLLTEKLPNAIGLKEYANNLDAWPAEEALRRRRELAEQVARLLRRLHRHQVSHRDLKAANILVVTPLESDHPQLFFIDLYGMKRWRKLPRSQRAQNLMRLYISFKDEPWLTKTICLRFLKTYLRQEREEAERWKVLWRIVDLLAEEKVKQNERRQRPLS